LPHPIYARVAAIIVTDISPVETKRLGLQRLAAPALVLCVKSLSSAFGQFQWTGSADAELLGYGRRADALVHNPLDLGRVDGSWAALVGPRFLTAPIFSI